MKKRIENNHVVYKTNLPDGIKKLSDECTQLIRMIAAQDDSLSEMRLQATLNFLKNKATQT